MKGLIPRLDTVIFVFCLCMICVVYGIFASMRGWFPAPQIHLAQRTATDLSQHWRNDYGLAPTRYFAEPVAVGPDAPAERGYVRHDNGTPQPGYVLITGFSDEPGRPFHVVRLYDQEGRQLHEWPVAYERFHPEGSARNVLLHGMEVFADGSLAVTFDVGFAIARIDACGETIWSRNGVFHHSMARDGQGTLVTWEGETIVGLDEDTGDELWRLDIRADIMDYEGAEQRGLLDIRTYTLEAVGDAIIPLADPFHPNDAEPLRAEMADAFPMFEAGDILFSLRELNFIGVAEPQTGRLKWYQHGPWIKQHDPDFQPDGTITVYDNATGTDRSLIRRIEPATGEMTIAFEGTEAQPFYSWRRGKHQVLPNGNILLAEAERGRALEVDPEGRIVWEREMPWDADHNLLVTEARHVPPDFFEGGVPQCGAPES